MKTKPIGVPLGKEPPEFGWAQRRAERLALLLGRRSWRAALTAYEAVLHWRGRGKPAEEAETAKSGQLGETTCVRSGFTLLELLVVISIIALLAALAMPVMRNFKPNYTASTSRQLLDDLARARQLAISQRTTVYMVFVPTNFWKDAAYGTTYQGPWSASDRLVASNLFEKQIIGYNFVSMRSLGDQPGRPTVRYLSNWKTLPEGAFIHPAKFLRLANPNQPVLTIQDPGKPPYFIYPFSQTNGIPFPSETTPLLTLTHKYVPLAYLGFDYLGRLTSGRDEIIPLTRGAITFNRSPDRKPAMGLPTFVEQPPGNTTNAYNLIYIDYITGRARALQQEVK